MKKFISIVLALVTVMSIGMSAFAAEPKPLAIRVNGELVKFKDTKPYIDAHDRTMVPVRFTTEALGAEVYWDGPSNTASISKNGVNVDITIGSRNIVVTKDGSSSNVAMDTEAVITGERTCVPIRFVAESLGAWVGFSDMANTVQVYQDELTPDEINRLHGYHDMTRQEYNDSLVAKGEKVYTTAEENYELHPETKHFVGTYGINNANEYVFTNPIGCSWKKASCIKAMNCSNTFTFGKQPNEDYAKLLFAEANTFFNVINNRGDLKVDFRSDMSCIFMPKSFSVPV
ncbi:MAG: copper amine oxidase N-terminal domain-containing protein, partial [Bacteroidales bacterium]